MADVMAIQLYGGAAFMSGLKKVVTNDAVFINIVHGQYVPELLKEKKMITDFSKIMESVYEQLDETKVDEIRADILAQSEQASAYDSHPTLAARLGYATRFEGSRKEDERPVSTVFDGWEELNKTAAELYNARLVHFLRASSQA